MKNLKRVLSLALATVMVIGMMVVGANATFADQADIDYTAAVDMLTGLGVLNGMGDNKFVPDGTVTRAQAAKMVAYVKAGANETTVGYYAGATKFTDVKDNHSWAAGSINYCVSLGIIAGRSATTYDPDGNVTGAELAKMMLVALGYSASTDDATTTLTGGNWQLNAIRMATETGLFNGMNSSFVATKAATRQEAAQIVYNALKASTWGINGKDSNGNYTYGPTAVSLLDACFTSLSKEQHQVITDNTATGADYTVVNGKNFATETGLDMVGHVVTVLYKTPAKTDAKGNTYYETYGVIEESKLVTVSKAISTQKDFVAAFGKTAPALAATNYKFDTNYVQNSTITDTQYEASTYVAAAGTFVLYDGKIVSFVAPESYTVEKVSAYTAPTAKANGSVSITNVKADGTAGTMAAITLNKIGSDEVDNIALYDGIAVGDYVAIQKIDTKGTTATKLNTVSSTMTSFTTGKEAVVGGTTYALSTVAQHADLSTTSNTIIGETPYTFVLDKSGAIVGYTTYVATSNANTYAVVLATDSKDGETAGVNNGFKTTYATASFYLALSNGDKAAYTITSKDKTAGNTYLTELNIHAGDVVKFAADGKNLTELTKVTGEAGAAVTAGSAISSAAGKYYTANTVFVYWDSTDTDFNVSVVTGYAKAQAATSDKVTAVMDDNGFGVFVYVNKAVAPTVAEDIAYFASTTYATTKYDTTLKAKVYGYTAYVNGEATTLWAKVDTLSFTAGLNKYTMTDGYLSAVEASALTAMSKNAITYMDDSVIVVNGVQYNYKDAQVITVDTTSGTAVVSAGGTLAVDTNVSGLYKVDANTGANVLNYIVVYVEA